MPMIRGVSPPERRSREGPGTVRSGRRREDLDVDVGGELAQRALRIGTQPGGARGRDDDRVDQVRELVAGGDAEEADAVVTGAFDDDRGHAVDAVRLGARAVDGEVEALDGDLVRRELR